MRDERIRMEAKKEAEAAANVESNRENRIDINAMDNEEVDIDDI